MKKAQGESSLLGRVISLVSPGPGIARLVVDKMEFQPSLEIVRSCQFCGSDRVWLEVSLRIGRREAYVGGCASCVRDFLVKTPGLVGMIGPVADRLPGIFDELELEVGKEKNGRRTESADQKVLPFVR